MDENYIFDFRSEACRILNGSIEATMKISMKVEVYKKPWLHICVRPHADDYCFSGSACNKVHHQKIFLFSFFECLCCANKPLLLVIMNSFSEYTTDLTGCSLSTWKLIWIILSGLDFRTHHFPTIKASFSTEGSVALVLSVCSVSELTWVQICLRMRKHLAFSLWIFQSKPMSCMCVVALRGWHTNGFFLQSVDTLR